MHSKFKRSRIQEKLERNAAPAATQANFKIWPQKFMKTYAKSSCRHIKRKFLNFQFRITNFFRSPILRKVIFFYPTFFISFVSVILRGQMDRMISSRGAFYRVCTRPPETFVAIGSQMFWLYNAKWFFLVKPWDLTTRYEKNVFRMHEDQ